MLPHGFLSLLGINGHIKKQIIIQFKQEENNDVMKNY